MNASGSTSDNTSAGAPGNAPNTAFGNTSDSACSNVFGQHRRRLIVGMSGASGAPLTAELLRQLQMYREEIEVHFIMTRSARMTLQQETDLAVSDLRALVDAMYDNDDICAGPSSGSFRTMGMVVVPCSMKTLAGIVTGYSDNLLLRAADVTLKEHRRLVLVPRECPLSNIHLRNLRDAGNAGAVILPPVLSYYNRPQSVEDCTRHIVGKIMDQFDLECPAFRRWEEPPAARPANSV